MDFQMLADSFSTLTCIFSVEKHSDGSYGNIRVVAGNKAFIASVEHKWDPSDTVPRHFVPDSPYEEYFPKDLNFEDSVYRAAILKRPIHSYIHPERYDFWFNTFIMPLESDKENIGYCTYSHEFGRESDSELMSDISLSTSQEVLKTCIKLHGTNDFRKTMDEIIGDIRALCDSKRCCILLTDFQERKCSVLCESSRDPEHIKPVRDFVNKDYFKVVETWPATIAGSDSLIISNPQDMHKLEKINSTWYNSLMRFNVQSIVLFPLIYNKETLGYIWATNFNAEYTERIRKNLKLTSFFLASEIYSRRLLEKLEIMSKTDLLTGILNRNAMNTRVDRLVSGEDKYPERLGVVFADLNGLKHTNDTGGHDAGDKLLRKAADAISEVFPDSEIYRAGGDEFMVMSFGITEEEFTKRIRKLRESGSDVCFAVGCCYENHPDDIRTAMHLADEDMYRHKELYYKSGHKR